MLVRRRLPHEPGRNPAVRSDPTIRRIVRRLHHPDNRAGRVHIRRDAGGTVRDWPTLPGWRLPADFLGTVRDWLTARL